jgi:hypothetical protein
VSRDAAAWRFREAPAPPAPMSPDPVADKFRRKPVALVQTADWWGGHAAGMPRAVEAGVYATFVQKLSRMYYTHNSSRLISELSSEKS